jgi:NADPH:quinone reductase-like Zn-dependent oxidoreductase
MLASVATGYGDADRVLSYRTDFPTPVIARPDQVLIRVKNAVVNPVDRKLRSGFMKAITRFKFPKVLGIDCAGGRYETWRKAKRLLGPSGDFASIAYPFDEQKMTMWDFIGLVLSIGVNKAEHLFGRPHFFWHLGEAREDVIEILASFFNQHPALRDLIPIHQFPLTELADAYHHVERHQGGKVVIYIS